MQSCGSQSMVPRISSISCELIRNAGSSAPSQTETPRDVPGKLRLRIPRTHWACIARVRPSAVGSWHSRRWGSREVSSGPLRYCFPPANGPPSVTFPQILSEARAKGVGAPRPGDAASPGARALLAVGGCVYAAGCWATITSTDQLQGSLPMPSCGNQRCLQTLPMSLGG